MGELRYTVGGAFNPQLLHSVSQRIRMHTESLGSAVCALYHAASLQENGGDVITLNFVKSLKSRSRLSGLDHVRHFPRCVAQSFGG